jgi:hypothetical protein
VSPSAGVFVNETARALDLLPLVALGGTEGGSSDSKEPRSTAAEVVPVREVDRRVVGPPGPLTRRVQEAFWSGLSLALALAMLFPLNYLGAEYNHREDYGYFKTARPGTSTVALVQGWSAPIKAYLFFPSSSEVTDELKTYFGDLAGPTFEVAYVDHALEPELAKELKVRENGTIALVRGEGDDQQVERVKIGEDFDSARRKLEQLVPDLIDWASIQLMHAEDEASKDAPRRSEVASFFSAALELTKNRAVDIRQDQLFSDVYVRKAHQDLRAAE